MDNHPFQSAPVEAQHNLLRRVPRYAGEQGPTTSSVGIVNLMKIDEFFSEKRKQKWGVSPPSLVRKAAISPTSGRKVVKTHQQDLLS